MLGGTRRLWEALLGARRHWKVLRGSGSHWGTLGGSGAAWFPGTKCPPTHLAPGTAQRLANAPRHRHPSQHLPPTELIVQLFQLDYQFFSTPVSYPHSPSPLEHVHTLNYSGNQQERNTRQRKESSK